MNSNFKIYCGSCFDLFPQLKDEPIDLVLSLPPIEWNKHTQERWVKEVKELCPNLLYWRGKREADYRLKPEHKIILDPCMGLGDVGIYALKTGRKFIGIELDPIRFKIAEQRLSQYQE